MDDAAREPVLSEVLATIRQLDDEDNVVDLVEEIAPLLSDPLYPEILTIARTLSNRHQRGWLLGHLAQFLPPVLLGEALSAAQTINHDFGKAQLFGEVLTRASTTRREPLAADALASARAISSAYYRVQALIELADHLPDRRDQLLTEALDTVNTTKGFDRAQLTAALAPLLSAARAEESINEALSLDPPTG